MENNIYSCLINKRNSFAVTCILFFLNVSGQQTDSITSKNQADSLRKSISEKVKEIGKKNAFKTTEEFRQVRIALKQDLVIAAIKKETQRAKIYLKRGIDTAGISNEMDITDKWYDIASDGIFSNTGTIQTHRNLTTTSKLLISLLEAIEIRKNQLENHHQNLQGFRDQIDSLSSDTSLYQFPADSIEAIQYSQKLSVTAKEIIPTDSIIKQASSSVHTLQIRVTMLANKLQSSIEEIDHYDESLSRNAFKRELPNIWGPVGYKRPLSEIFHFSELKTTKELWLYTTDNSGKIILLILLILMLSRFLRTLKKKLINQGELKNDFSGQLVFRYPVHSSIMIILNLFQFIFINPPFVFNAFFWIISSVCLTMIFMGFIVKYWLRVWLSMSAFFLLACINNLVLQASRDERIVMLFLALAGVICGTYVFLHGRKNELREKAILYFIGVVVIVEVTAIISNIFGRYNLSKNLLTSGYINIIIGILFLWTVRLINEILAVTSEVYTTPERKSFYINFGKVGNKVPFVFYLLLIAGWFTLSARNFYSFNLIAKPVNDFLFDERTVGDYTFTFSNIFIFFLIMGLATIISKLVSFFASDSYDQRKNSKRKQGIGSWVLLIRIIVITAGIFLATAATGIPMDKLTIIIGALSVGIGLGLQSLVNNLVSGLIIAFEKPVNTGDIIEVAGHSGTVKSIGFRSSIIATGEGSDVVIPNGDLLNAHLVNWTVRDNKRKVTVEVGVAYGSDLKLVKDILTEIMNSNNNIIKSPSPVVLFKDFGSSAIEVKISCWVNHYSESVTAKSALINEINDAFKEKNIHIPFPQQDIHIHSYSENDKTTSIQSGKYTN